MADTYCGKSCENCEYREELKCNGCKNGPGRELYGDCDVAGCCRNKMFESCMECQNWMGCETYNGASRKAYFRTVKTDINQSQDREKLERSRFMGKYVRIIFILSILQIITNVLSNQRVALISYNLYQVALIASVVVGLIYGVILLFMSKESKQFMIAGIICIAAPIISILSIFTYNLTLVGFISVAMIIAAFVAQYLEMRGYSDTLSGINNALSVKWMEIWKGLITWLIVMVVGAFVSAIIPIVGVIAVLVAAIGIIVVSIKRLICILDTANAFETYTKLHE